MATSYKLLPLNPPAGMCRVPPRTPGPLGYLDQADPAVTSLLGDSRGPLGTSDWASPDLPRLRLGSWTGGMCRADDGQVVALATGAPAPVVPARTAAGSMSLSDDGLTLLGKIEALRLKPYDDQSGGEITEWVDGATVGYGHLIAKADWDKYKGGLTKDEARKLYAKDLLPFVKAVRNNITALVTQTEFDALVMLAYNLGPTGFANCAVVTLVNDPEATTGHAGLEAAWKAYNKNRNGQVMKGLENRRQCEWDIYTKGVYKQW